MSTKGYQAAAGGADWSLAAARVPTFAALAVRTSEDTDSEVCAAEAALLPPRAVSERRETFRLGRLAAHDALHAIGLDTGPVLSGPSREPLWPPGVAGSISHTAAIGVALVAPADRTDGIGVDVEAVRRAPELEAQVPRPEERSWLDAGEPSQRDHQLFALFSAKESVFKAFFPHVGRFFGFEAASLLPTSSGFTGSLVEPIDSRYPPTRTFDIACHWLETTVMTWLILPKTS